MAAGQVAGKSDFPHRVDRPPLLIDGPDFVGQGQMALRGRSHRCHRQMPRALLPEQLDALTRAQGVRSTRSHERPILATPVPLTKIKNLRDLEHAPWCASRARHDIPVRVSEKPPCSADSYERSCAIQARRCSRILVRCVDDATQNCAMVRGAFRVDGPADLRLPGAGLRPGAPRRSDGL